MDDPSLYIKWKTMWDAQELTTQLFFLANVIIGLVIAMQPFRGGKGGSAVKRGMVFALGTGYVVLVLIAYFQLVPTFSPYQ
jgi:hypothetical protein